MRKIVVTVVTVNFKKMGNVTKNSGYSGYRLKKTGVTTAVTTRMVTPSGPIYLTNQVKRGGVTTFSKTYTHYRKKNVSGLQKIAFSHMRQKQWLQWLQWLHPKKPSYITIRCNHCCNQFTLCHGDSIFLHNVKRR